MKTTLWLAAMGMILFGAIAPVAAKPLVNDRPSLDRVMPLAVRGDPFAQFTLGAMYDDGIGVPQNYFLAFKWYLRAAENGLADAQYMVGKFYAAGRGMKQSPFKAYVWSSIATAAGYPRAELLRDQERGQMSRPRIAEAQRLAVQWQRRHPRRISCRSRRCLHPNWIQKPQWGLLAY